MSTLAAGPGDAGRGVVGDPAALAPGGAARPCSTWSRRRCSTRCSRPPREDPEWLTLSTNIVVIAAIMAWGMYIGSRRELLWTLRNRAETAEAEQELRVSQARSNERARIAREMHDVLAHRISQISMHAGALSFRDDLTADEMRDSVAVIQEKAHEALTDLRGVLGVLRDDGSGRAGRGAAADVRRPARAGHRGGGGGAERGPRRRAGHARNAGARRGRPHALPDRAGRHHQRPQARAREPADDPGQRLAGGRRRHPAAQPDRLRALGGTGRRPRPGRAHRAGRARRRPPGAPSRRADASCCTRWIPWAS